MEIDIISFTDEQYARLSDEQLIQVKDVQIKKNKLLRALEEAKATERYRMLKDGIFLGASYAKVCEQLQAVYEEEINNLRDGLLFYLRFSVRDDNGEEAPYLVDYSLDYVERIRIVREYYETTYPDAVDRLLALKEDQVAMSYLGEYYSSLYELYRDEAYPND